jgi:hypothetical protein
MQAVASLDKRLSAQIDAVDKKLSAKIDAVYEELVARSNDNEQHNSQPKRPLKRVA